MGLSKPINISGATVTVDFTEINNKIDSLNTAISNVSNSVSQIPTESIDLSGIESTLSTINTNVSDNKTTLATVNTNAANAKTYTTTNNTASKTGVLSQKDSYIISMLENTTFGLNAIKTAAASGGTKTSKIVKFPNITINNSSYTTVYTRDKPGVLRGMEVITNATTLLYAEIYIDGNLFASVSYTAANRTSFYLAQWSVSYGMADVWDNEKLYIPYKKLAIKLKANSSVTATTTLEIIEGA